MSNLSDAKVNKNDEFYTMLEDIVNELCNYPADTFDDKVVYLNCDDPYESNFFKFFAENFRELNLKALMATCYGQSKIAGCQLKLFDDFTNPPPSVARKSYKIILTKEIMDTYSSLKVEEILKKNGIVTRLDGNGDFRSFECQEMLHKADIVVTNPPFSKFLPFINLMVKYNKKFIIIGNKNEVVCRSIFPLFKDGKVWFGTTVPDRFYTPDGSITDKVSGLCRWYTNVCMLKERKSLVPTAHYDPDKYDKFDNYDAINVDSIKDIPCDYSGKMGVPLTYFDYTDNIFKVVGFRKGKDGQDLAVDGDTKYARIIIQKK